MVLWGAKDPAPSSSTLSNINMTDRKLQPGGKIYRDPSPRPAMTTQWVTTQLAPERVGHRQEDWRREKDMEKIRAKARSSDMDIPERYLQKERTSAPRWREGEKEVPERERRHEDDRSKHVTALMNVQMYIKREMEKGIKKGDTFPRMTNSYADLGRRKTSDATNDEDRGERRRREMYDWERTRERDWQREHYRERAKDGIPHRAIEEGKNTGRRPSDDGKVRQGDRYQELGSSGPDRGKEGGDSRERKERYAARNKENPKSDTGGKESLSPHRHRSRDREIDTYRRETEKTQKSGGRRDVRSEGDSVERNPRRERVKDREREISKSEEESNSRRVWEGGRARGQRYRDEDRERGVDRSRRRGEEKGGEQHQGKREAAGAGSRDRGPDVFNHRLLLKDQEYNKYQEYKQRKYRKAKDAELRWDGTTEKILQPLQMSVARGPPRDLSSEERSINPDSEMLYRRRRGSYNETGRESAAKTDKDVRQKDPRTAAEESQIKPKRSERHESDKGEVTGSKPGQRRMWLEPQRDKNRKGDISDTERHKIQKERRDEGRKEHHDPRGHSDQHHYRDIHRGINESRGETEEVSVDGDDVDDREEHLSDSNGLPEGTLRSDAEAENAEDKEVDKGEEGGSDCFTRAGSETGSELKNQRTLSAEGYATFSSGSNDEDGEEFQDCLEAWECGNEGTSPVGFKTSEGHDEDQMPIGDKEEQETEKKPKYVFCVIGSQHEDTSPSDVDQVADLETHKPELEESNHCWDDITQTPQDDLHPAQSTNHELLIISDRHEEGEAEPDTSKEEPPGAAELVEAEPGCMTSSVLQDTETGEETRRWAEVTELKRDSQTERLLVQWREKENEAPEDHSDRPSPVPSNPYADVPSEVNFQQVLGEIQPEVLGSKEEEESVQVQMGKGWTMCEEPKRHSQAPHLKWAKNVVRDILGHSEEEIMDEPHSDKQEPTETETGNKGSTHEEELAQGTSNVPFIMLTRTEQNSDPELKEEDSLEELRGMPQSQGGTRFSATYDDTLTHTHADTLLNTEGREKDSMDKDTEPSGRPPLKKADVDFKVKITCEAANEGLLEEAENEEASQKDGDMYLSVGNTLYKPNSCPSLNCKSASEVFIPSREGKNHEAEARIGESEEDMQGEGSKGWVDAEVGKTIAEGKTDNKQAEVAAGRRIELGLIKSSGSFQELGYKSRFLRRGFGKSEEKRDGEPAEEEEDEEEGGVGRDRRTRIFSTTDDEDDWSKTWGGAELKNAFNPFSRQKRKSKFFKRTLLYQQYNEAAQNLEILSQSGSDAHRLPEDSSSSPSHSPPPARRPLPALPPVLHPHHVLGSFSSAKNLPLPEPPKNEGRPPSPRLSVSFAQSPTLWRDLPGVRNNPELGELSEDQRRLQEVQFEVLTSETSYCRSLDIVVEHFVKSKQLGTLLTNQDRNWLFSRLADVRAISHSFLLKLEERVESNIMHFTVCDIIIQHCQRFRKVYVPYLTNQSYQDATYQRLMNENPGFKRTVEKLERNSVCERLPFRSFLVLPFQRITRLKLLVQNIVKRTTPGTTEATQAIKAMKLLEKVIQESNDSISQMKNIESLVSLNAKVEFEAKTLPLVSQSRRLIREGPVIELIDFSFKDTERNAYLHLFNDFLLVSLLKEGGRFTVIDHSPVKEVRVENCRLKLLTLHKNLFRLHTAQRSLLLRTETQSDKLRWISALSRPHPEVDFSAAQDLSQMQCIRAFVAQQPDELSLDKADIILVHQNTSDHWVEGTRLPDGTRGWVPESNLEIISNSKAKQRNLSDALKLTTATAAV